MYLLSRIVTFQPRFKSAFRDLNLEWIRKYFRVEAKDLEQVNNPESCLAQGGEIFFVLNEAQESQNDDQVQAIGTCAMYKNGPNRYELAKMAVRPDHQGRGLGTLLMKTAEEWAQGRDAREVLILSNTILEPAICLYRKFGYKTVHLGPHPDYERCNIEMLKCLSPLKTLVSEK